MINTIYSDELYHYGVKGMKWGERKEEIRSNRLDYRSLRKTQNKDERLLRNGWAGIKQRDRSRVAEKRRKKLAGDVADARAKYAMSKAKTEKKANRAEFKAYKREMYRNGGIRESFGDISGGGKATAVYDRVKAQKGKAYADRVEKSVQNTAIAVIAGSTALAIGASFAENYYLNKY